MEKIWSILRPALMLAMFLSMPSQTWAMGMEMEAEEDASEGGDSKLSLHGYGELHYNIPADGGNSNMDLHRMVWGLSYEFSDRISLHTEVDFEHSAQAMELEFAYIDILGNSAINLRAGSMLMPVGSLNEYHEPVLFYSVERPLLYSKIIPTTWQEGGIGLFGSLAEGLKYRVYVVSGLAGEGFSASSGIRGGRGKAAGGKGGNPKTGEKLAIVARVEYSPILGLDLGASYYKGGVDQVNSIGGSPKVGIAEVDGRVRMAGIDFQATYTQINVDEADKISAVASCKTEETITDTSASTSIPDSHQHGSTTSCDSIGSQMKGWYVELAYHLSYLTHSDWDLVPFIRVSELNTQDEMPTGFTANPKNDRKIKTYGVSFLPDPRVAFKADFQNIEDASGGDVDQYNLAVAYMF